MIVYIESNFVLELALLQDEHRSCDSIVSIAESQSIDLAIPAFSLVEPYEVLRRRTRERTELYTRLTLEMSQLARTETYTETVERMRDSASVLEQSGDEDKRRLDLTLGKILDCAAVIPLQGETLKEAIQFQGSLDLSPQDSVVYASVIAHLSAASPGPKCFLNRDRKDFSMPDIKEELGRYDCRLINRFDDGLSYTLTRHKPDPYLHQIHIRLPLNGYCSFRHIRSAASSGPTYTAFEG